MTRALITGGSAGLGKALASKIISELASAPSPRAESRSAAVSRVTSALTGSVARRYS